MLIFQDVKIQLTTVPRQTVQTKDNVSVEIDSVISWHVVSPYRAAFGINNLAGALVERAQTTLRQVVGGRVLQSLISDREGLAQEVAEIIETTAEKWGVSIESILLKDINFSAELQQSLSSAATQKRIGESKVIAARAEVDAAKLMRQGMYHPSILLLTLSRRHSCFPGRNANSPAGGSAVHVPQCRLEGHLR